MRELPYPPGTRFVLYARDSGGPSQELSVDQQVAEISALCRRQGFILTRSFEDRARSGKSSAGRDQFLEMVHYLTKDGGGGEAGVLLWSYARFYRRFKHFQYYIASIEIAGYKVISLLNDLPDTLEGELMRSVIAYSDERQVLTQGYEIRRGLRSRARDGGSPSGNLPAGYRAVYERYGAGTKRDGSPRTLRKLVPDPDAAPIVQRAWRMRAEGRTIREIHAETRLFRSNAGYSYMFRNPVYIGQLTYAGGEIVTPGAVEPLVDADTWQRVQARNRPPNENQMHPRRVSSSYLLSGILRCGVCGRLMFGKPHSKPQGPGKYVYRGYMCPGRGWMIDRCAAPQISARRLEDKVLSALKETFTAPEFAGRVREELAKIDTTAIDDAHRARTAARAELAELNKTLDNLYRFVEAAGYETDDEARAIRTRIGQREAERREKLSEIARLEAARPPEPKPVPDMIDGEAIWQAIRWAQERDPRQLQLLLRAMLKEVRAVGDGRRHVAGTLTIRELAGIGQVEISVPLG